MEQVHYWWAAKKYLLLATSNSKVRYHNQLTEATPYWKKKLHTEGPFQTASSISETLKFDTLCQSCFLDERFELATQGTYFNLK